MLYIKVSIFTYASMSIQMGISLCNYLFIYIYIYKNTHICRQYMTLYIYIELYDVFVVCKPIAIIHAYI